jgi:hypothetical protein
VIVGADEEGGPSDNKASAGAAYVFERSGESWGRSGAGGYRVETEILRATNADGEDRFGRSVAISGDQVVVGAFFEDGPSDNKTDTGAAYVVNDLPSVFDDSMRAIGATRAEVLANDDSGLGTLDASSVRVASAPTHGTAAANADGTITYTPTDGFRGEHSFTYTVANENGERSGEATLTVDEVLPDAYGAGQAVVLDGTDDYVGLPDDPAINTDGPYETRTIELWFKAADASGSDEQVLYEEGGKTNGFNLYLKDGSLYVGVWSESKGWSGRWFSTSAVESGIWYHAALVFDRPEGILRGYLNGHKFGDVTPGSRMSAHGGKIGIGASVENTSFRDAGDVDRTGHYFEGRIDQVRLWDGALTGKQVRARAKRTIDLSAPVADSLIASYRFDTGSGTTAYDYSSADGSQDGTFEGDPQWATFSGASFGDVSAVVSGGRGEVGSTGGAVTVENVPASDTLQVYRYGRNGGALIDDTGSREDFAGTGAARRLHVVWGLDAVGTGPSGDVTFDAAGLNGGSDLSNLLLLRRDRPGAAWTDVTGDWTVDVGAQTVSKSGGVSAGQYALAQPANQPPTLDTNTGLTVDEGTAANPISQSALSASDPEQGAGAITYDVTSAVSHGTLFIDGAVADNGRLESGEEVGTGTFTQADLEAGNLRYSHDGSETTSDEFTFDLTDGNGGRISGNTFTLNIRPVNDAPTISGDLSISVDEGGRVTLAGSDLDGSDPDDGPSDLTYTVTGTLAHGTIEVGGSAASTFTEADLDGGEVAYVHDDSETTTDDVEVRLADGGEDGADAVTTTIAVSISLQNDEAPAISDLSDEKISAQETLGPMEFTVEDEDTAVENLTVAASSDNQSIVPDSRITLSGKNDGNPKTRTIEIDPVDDKSGMATITVTASDGENSTREAFELTVDSTPDLAITDGSAKGLDVPARVLPGTDNNRLGVFRLSADRSGASFEGVTVTMTATDETSSVTGLTRGRLYWSTDRRLDVGRDRELDAVSINPSGAAKTITFSGFSRPIPSSARYVILAVDVKAGVTMSDVQGTLARPKHLQTPEGEIATVNGNRRSTFSALSLSNGTTWLPVALSGFEATIATEEKEAQEQVPYGKEMVRVTWKTTNERDNDGFEVQRKRPEAPASDWTGVGFVESKGNSRGKSGGAKGSENAYRFGDVVSFTTDSLEYRLRQEGKSGAVSFYKPETVVRGAVDQVRLLGTFPNPARRQATVRFAIPKEKTGRVRLRVYDLLGREVRTVRRASEAGRHKMQLDVTGLSSGVYLLQLVAEGTVKSQRMTVLR